MRIWRNLKANKELLNAAAKSKAFIIFDTETTGLTKNDQIIEFAAYKCVFTQGEFKPYEIKHIYIKPDKPVPEKATEVNGITNEFLADKPSEREVFTEIDQFLGPNPALGAYNSKFDIKKLTEMYERQGKSFHVGLDVDALKIAKDIFCEQKLKDHKLITIANTYGVDEGIQFHSAIDDVKVLTRVINAMIKDMNANGSEDTSEHASVYRLNFYEGYRGNSRLYLVTSKGMMYYDLRNDCFLPAKNSPIDISRIDLPDVEEQMFSLAGCNTYPELRKKCAERAFG